MRGTRPLPFALVTALFAVGCGNSSSTNVTAPTTRCQPSISAPTTSFGPGGGSGSVTVTIARECAWSAASDVSWLVITSAREGHGDGTIAFRIGENPDPVRRRGGLSVNGERVQLSQDPGACRFEVATSASEVSPAGGDVVVQVRTHDACTWSASTTAPWLAPSPQSGTGGATVRISVAANSSAAARSGELTIAGERIAILQLPGSSPAPPGPTPVPAPPAPTPPAPAPPSPNPGPTPGREIELEGDIGFVSGSCPALTFTLRGRTVYTTQQTEFKKAPCNRVVAGAEVEMKGREMSDGRVRADEVRLEK